ncbi:MAG: hypothetical protein J7J11_04275 [Desulfurococcales archaeon]|nr:hypothetical protein [Desulfurococcales archaeon]
MGRSIFKWPPPRRKYPLTVVFPSSNLNIYPTLREKTEVAGIIARILATYRVDNIIVFRDRESIKEDFELLQVILNYLVIPPYLRKKIVPLVPELKYVGLLPPLNIVTHNPEGKDPEVGDVREGVITASWGRVARTYIGYKKQCRVSSLTELSPGARILVKITSVRPLKGEATDPDKLKIYIGYRVFSASSDDELFSILSKLNGVVVLTTKDGMSYHDIKLRKAIIAEAVSTGGLVLLFGNPKHDFNELAEAVLKRINVRFRVNFIPYQGVYAVRTIEALSAVLAQLSTDMITFKGERY